MTCSPFLLGGVINEHLNTWESHHPELIKEIRDGLYVDDLMTGGETVELTAVKKVITTEVFKDATFTIHKWHSNASELETTSAHHLKSCPMLNSNLEEQNPQKANC